MVRRKKKTSNTNSTLKLIVAALVLLVVVWTMLSPKKAAVEVTVDQSINLTPEQIQSIRDIGEWELLSVSDEEMIDTVSKGWIKDSKLARIYYGTLRFGIDLKSAKEGWMQTKGDTVVVTLPKVKLLDRDFIDEARTKSFYESGRWTNQDRQTLYSRAHQQMLAHCYTEKNLQEAEENAVRQMKKILAGMGFDKVEVLFER